MFQWVLKLYLIIYIFHFSAASQAEVSVKDDGKGNIIYRNGDFLKSYKNTTGMYLGASRFLTAKKGLSELVLYTGDKNEKLFTLDKKSNGLYIDCMLHSSRSKTNLARIQYAVCGLNKPLTSDYMESSYPGPWFVSLATTYIQPKINYYFDIPLGSIKKCMIVIKQSTI